MRLIRRFLFFFLSLTLCGCEFLKGYGGHVSEPTVPPLEDNRGQLSRPVEAHIDLSNISLTKFNDDLPITLFRYLAGNPRWEIREERGLKYAVRLEPVNGNYITSLNGFYGTYENNQVRQTRVLLAFGAPYGFGKDRGNITRVTPGSDDVSIIVESDHEGTPGNSSYVIIDGEGLFLEIYEQAPELERRFTQKAFDEVSAEFEDVLKNREEVNTTGILPVAARYPEPLPKEKAFVVVDGMEPGIYLIDAAINPTTSGYAYIRVYNAKSGERLSEDEINGSSMRFVGWSQDGKTFFHYTSEITINEGDWSNQYEARFELWHRSDSGAEIKMAETTRMISGWQR